MEGTLRIAQFRYYVPRDIVLIACRFRKRAETRRYRTFGTIKLCETSNLAYCPMNRMFLEYKNKLIT